MYSDCETEETLEMKALDFFRKCLKKGALHQIHLFPPSHYSPYCVGDGDVLE